MQARLREGEGKCKRDMAKDGEDAQVTSRGTGNGNGYAGKGELFLTFSASIPSNFLEEPVERLTNSNHMITEYCNQS